MGRALPRGAATHFTLVAAAGVEADVLEDDVCGGAPVVHRDARQQEDGEGRRV